MVNYKTFIFVKLLTVYNWINDIYNNLKYKTKHFYNYIKDYCSGAHDTWIFIPGHTLPMSVSNSYNRCNTMWIYDNNNCVLEIFNDTNDKYTVKFSWLSAKIRITSCINNEVYYYEYNIDDFIDNFRLRTFNDITPDLKMIYLTWCTYSKHWFSEKSKVEFLIIDDEGQDHILNIKDENICLAIKYDKICVVIDSTDATNIGKSK
jgi:hypothetical protein